MLAVTQVTQTTPQVHSAFLVISRISALSSRAIVTAMEQLFLLVWPTVIQHRSMAAWARVAPIAAVSVKP
jgi:hypothetical protein